VVSIFVAYFHVFTLTVSACQKYCVPDSVAVSLSGFHHAVRPFSEPSHRPSSVLISVFTSCCHITRSRSSSGSIVSGYGLDDREIEVRSPAGAKDISSNLCVQTGFGAHPAPCTMGTGGPFPAAKHGRGVTLTTHPYLLPRSWMSRSYTSSPPKRLHGV
jgi:hypothetical protein